MKDNTYMGNTVQWWYMKAKSYGNTVTKICKILENHGQDAVEAVAALKERTEKAEAKNIENLSLDEIMSNLEERYRIFSFVGKGEGKDDFVSVLRAHKGIAFDELEQFHEQDRAHTAYNMSKAVNAVLEIFNEAD